MGADDVKITDAETDIYNHIADICDDWEHEYSPDEIKAMILDALDACWSWKELFVH